MAKVIIIGATSAIAQATARLFASRGDELFLVARGESAVGAANLASLVEDLKVRGAKSVSTAKLDVLNYAQHEPVIATAFKALGSVDTVFIAHGALPDQERCDEDFSLTREAIEVNFLSVVSLLTCIVTHLKSQRPISSTIAVISSVAGERGRQSNYVYGSSKAALDIYLAGLRNQLFKHGIHVLTIKPGFVDTPMTADIPKNFLFASPERVADGIVGAINARRNVAYLPWFWHPIMLIIRSIPEEIFKRLKL